MKKTKTSKTRMGNRYKYSIYKGFEVTCKTVDLFLIEVADYFKQYTFYKNSRAIITFMRKKKLGVLRFENCGSHQIQILRDLTLPETLSLAKSLPSQIISLDLSSKITNHGYINMITCSNKVEKITQVKPSSIFFDSESYVQKFELELNRSCLKSQKVLFHRNLRRLRILNLKLHIGFSKIFKQKLYRSISFLPLLRVYKLDLTGYHDYTFKFKIRSKEVKRIKFLELNGVIPAKQKKDITYNFTYVIPADSRQEVVYCTKLIYNSFSLRAVGAINEAFILATNCDLYRSDDYVRVRQLG